MCAGVFVFKRRWSLFAQLSHSFLFVSRLWPMGLNVLGCQPHLLQQRAILPVDTKHLPISPRFSPYMDFYRDAWTSSALSQLVNQWLKFTYSSRSPAFRYGSQNPIFRFHKNRTQNLRTSKCTWLPTRLDRPLERRGLVNATIFIIMKL